MTGNNQQNNIHPFIPLIITSVSLQDKRNFLTVNINNPVLSYVQITHLNVDCSRVPIIIVIELIRCLPNMTSLIIIPLTVLQIFRLSDKQIENLVLDSRNNKLIKLKLRLITEIQQALFFIRLARYIEYLEIECSNDIDLEVLVQCILIKTDNHITSQLCSICLCAGRINDEIIKKLHRIMALKDCVYNYSIQHICDRIYLKWK